MRQRTMLINILIVAGYLLSGGETAASARIFHSSKVGCTVGQFECDDGMCIPSEWVCDGFTDCPFGEDEENCLSTAPHSSGTTTIPWGSTEPATSTWTSSPSTTAPSTLTSSPSTTAPSTLTSSPSTTAPSTLTSSPSTTAPSTLTSSPFITESSTSNPFETTSGPWNSFESTSVSYNPFETTSGPWNSFETMTQTETTYNPYSTSQAPPVSCNHPFDRVDNRCLFVDPVLRATWEEAENMCKQENAVLVILDDLDFYSDLVQYINDNGLERHDYWVGATEIESDSTWQWVNGENVFMYTPLWAIKRYDNYSRIYKQEPTWYMSSLLTSCGYLQAARFHYMDNATCEEQKAAICQLPHWNEDRKMDLSVSQELRAKVTVPEVSCSHPFVAVGGRCILVDPNVSATWDEAKYVCETSSGADLVILDSMNFYGKLIEYLVENKMNIKDFWVGARGSAADHKWEWQTGAKMINGTPLWALSGYSTNHYDFYSQEPLQFDDSLSQCGYLNLDRFLYLDDFDCEAEKSIICQLPTTNKEDHPKERQLPKGIGFDREKLMKLPKVVKDFF